MKLKKILACGMAVAMLASASVANAALVVTDNDDYGKVATSLPTKDEIVAIRPTLEVTPQKLTTQNEVKSLSSLVWSNKHKITDVDVYRLDFKFTNIGDLFNGFDAKDNSAVYGISYANVSLHTSEISNDNLAISKSSGAPAGASSVSCTLNDGYIVAFAQYDPSNPYPFLNTDEFTYAEVTDGTMTFTALAAVPKGASVNVDGVKCNLTFTVNNVNTELNEVGNKANGVITVPASFTIGEATKPETIGVDATLLVSNDVAQEGITTNGYIWKVDLTNAAAISDFKATFKAGEENAERKIRNMKALTDAMGGEGTYSFNVGLNTKKTGVTAKFEVTDRTNTAVWPAE